MPRGIRAGSNVEVLARLGHHGLIGGDDQQDAVDAPTPASIVRTKRSWPGTSTNAIRVSPTTVGEPELDGDAALFFLLEAIRIDAGQCPDERALP
jgi:hypothetical protein